MPWQDQGLMEVRHLRPRARPTWLQYIDGALRKPRDAPQRGCRQAAGDGALTGGINGDEQLLTPRRHRAGEAVDAPRRALQDSHPAKAPDLVARAAQSDRLGPCDQGVVRFAEGLESLDHPARMPPPYDSHGGTCPELPNLLQLRPPGDRKCSRKRWGGG